VASNQHQPISLSLSLSPLYINLSTPFKASGLNLNPALTNSHSLILSYIFIHFWVPFSLWNETKQKTKQGAGKKKKKKKKREKKKKKRKEAEELAASS
jgi:hypothetical protein